MAPLVSVELRLIASARYASALPSMMRRPWQFSGSQSAVGTWSLDGGGWTAQVFLPAGGADAQDPTEPEEGQPEPEPASEEVEHDPNHWVKAEQALVRELRELSQGKAR